MPTQLHAAEAVLPGHPDKLCDAIADALVQEASRRDRRAFCCVDVAVQGKTVFVAGRIGCPGAKEMDVEAVVRAVFASVGYGDEWKPNPADLKIVLELRRTSLGEEEAERRAEADDQCLVTGYAVDLPGTNHIPPEQWLAARLVRRLERLRTEAPSLRLGPDGKLIVLLEEDRLPTRLAGFSASLHQARDGPAGVLEKAVLAALGEELHALARAVPGFDASVPEAVAINAATNAHVGGPEKGSGQSGRHLVADTYGPRVPVGGAILSGRDFYQPARAGAIAARRLAKGVVLTGAAHECRATLAFVPGQTEAQIVALVGDGQLLDAARWSGLLDRSLAGLGDRYTNQVDLVEVARYGPFTTTAHPWEQLHFDAPARRG